jgi:hypothetical protein
MVFTKRLREGVKSGAITCSVRIWTRPKVIAGRRYQMEEGEIEIDSIERIALFDITHQLAIESGFLGVIDLLKVAKHGPGDNVYLIRFHYVPPSSKKPAPMGIDTLLRSYPEDVQTLAREARKTLQKWLPKAGESVDASARMIGYHYGPGYKGMVCTLLLSRSGIKLGLFGGATLADPRGLLAGTGKVHRHVQLRTVRDLQQPGLKQLVLGASAACHKRLD